MSWSGLTPRLRFDFPTHSRNSSDSQLGVTDTAQHLQTVQQDQGHDGEIQHDREFILEVNIFSGLFVAWLSTGEGVRRVKV